MSFNDYWQAQQRRRAVAVAIAQLPTGGSAAQAQLYEALRPAVLLLSVAELPEGHANGEVVTGQNVPIKLALVKGPGESLFVPSFTSEEALHRSHSEESLFVLLPFRAIAQMALSAGAVGVLLDRGGPHSAIVPRTMLQSLGAGQPPVQAIAPDGTATTSPPSPPMVHLSPPPRLLTYSTLARLHEWLGKQPGLVQAYLFGLLHGAGKPVLTIGMGFLQSFPREEVERLAREAAEVMGSVGVILLDGRLATLLSRQAGAIRFDFNVEDGATEADEPATAPAS